MAAELESCTSEHIEGLRWRLVSGEQQVVPTMASSLLDAPTVAERTGWFSPAVMALQAGHGEAARQFLLLHTPGGNSAYKGYLAETGGDHMLVENVVEDTPDRPVRHKTLANPIIVGDDSETSRRFGLEPDGSIFFSIEPHFTGFRLTNYGAEDLVVILPQTSSQ